MAVSVTAQALSFLGALGLGGALGILYDLFRLLRGRLGLRRQQLWATRLMFQAEGALSYLNGCVFETACPF